jgi:hypothetical protein
MIVFERESGMDKFVVSYYPGMVELVVMDVWHDVSTTFNVSMKDWRAMNTSIEAAHNGENNEG